jgi:hypothetical protein
VTTDGTSNVGAGDAPADAGPVPAAQDVPGSGDAGADPGHRSAAGTGSGGASGGGRGAGVVVGIAALAFVVLVAVAVLGALALTRGDEPERGEAGDIGARSMRYLVLTPNADAHSQPAVIPATVAAAAGVLRRRLAAARVTGGSVRVAPEGRRILVGVPARDRGLLTGLAAPGRLEFRVVYAMGAPTGSSLDGLPPARSSAPPPSADVLARYGAERCGQGSGGTPGGTDVAAGAGQAVAAEWMVGCDRPGDNRYLLGPARIGNGGVASAVAYPAGPGAVVGPTRGWTVVVFFTAAGQTAFTDLTADTVGKQIAVVLDGVVWSAPTVDMRINGPAEVASDVDQAPARALAAVLSVGPLPVALTGSVVTSAVPPGFS